MRVNPPSPYTKERSRWILRQMTRLSGISYAKLDSSVSAQASVEDSSAISDSLLNTQPVNSMSLTPDSLLQDSLSNVRMQNNTTIEDTSTDSIPAF
jgi:hypothetical protein